MTKQDLKHALISLAIGVTVTALTSLVQGALHIVTEWLTPAAGGAAGGLAYLGKHHNII